MLYLATHFQFSSNVEPETWGGFFEVLFANDQLWYKTGDDNFTEFLKFHFIIDSDTREKL